MLETPLFGRFIGENKYLVFAPASAYLWLVGSCVFGGTVMAVYALRAGWSWGLFVGMAVFAAGLWAAFSLQWISFNLRERVYTRRQGPGLFPRTSRGSLGNLEAIFLLAESRPLFGQVTYRLVLQWRGMAEPVMILQQEYRQLPPGHPLNWAAGPMYHMGARAANAIGVPIVDYAQVSTPCPVPIAPIR